MPAPRPAVFLLAAAATVLVSCTKEELPWEFSGCDPVDPSMCALPFPSTTQLKVDETSATGWRVNFDGQDFPRPETGQFLDLTTWNERDGFSVGTPFLAGFGQLDLTNLPGKGTIARYADEDIGSILLDLDTGERVPHWVEVDAHTQDPAKRLTVLWPATQLAFDHTYVVAFRDLTRDDGSTVAPSEAFLALRDKDKTEDADIENRRDHYEDVIFPALEEASFPREDLVLAWSAHTASEASTRGRVFAMRDQAYAMYGDGAPEVRWHTVEEFDCSVEGEHISKSLRGRFDAPLFTEDPGVDTRLNRDQDGMPFADGTREAQFVVQIPCSVAANPGPTKVIQYGHGLLGDEGEARAGWLEKFADDNRFIVVAGRQTGMCVEDYAAIGIMLSRDLSGFPAIPERLHQGIVENLLLTRIITRTMPSDAELMVDGTALLSGKNEDVAWYGISQGAIVGGAIVGASPDIDRAVISVGGGPYALLLPRSVDFESFFDILRSRFPDERDQMFLIQGLLIQLWDVGESAGWVDTLKDKQVLSQVGIGDAQVHLEGARWQARGAGLSLIEDPVSDVFGLDTKSTPYTGSGYVEVDYGVPVGPDVNIPPDKSTDTHECVRRSPELQQQVVHFINTGEIDHFCDGPCQYEWTGSCR